MEVLQSLEVRWFLEARSLMALELNDWFKEEPLENDGDRKDLYYVDPQRPDLNAKARGGEQPKLEFKYRLGVLEALSLTPKVVGHVERWNKLSLKVDAELSQYPQIIAVSKARRQRKFSFDGQTLTQVNVKANPDAGCGVELTTIQASCGTQSATACSLGFEAFGPRPVSLEALIGTVREVLSARPAMHLLASQSENYSSWLIRHFAKNPSPTSMPQR
ncbi:MAG TPA: hypothetical protein VJV79_26240 [Polyangiaceae bacterium]|nr:hypothetical protein [Polyangiaceae bacterium]